MDEHSHSKDRKLSEDGGDKKAKGGFWSEIIKFTLIAVVIVVPIRVFIAQPFIVSGASMDPTFKNGEYLIVDQLSYRLEQPKRESVIIFRYPKKPSTFFIKRVIGLPGEKIEIEKGVVKVINEENPKGFILTDDYVDPNNKKYDDFEIDLGSEEYFVMGDNRLGSLDSRAWGPVKEDLIIGRPIIRVLPFDKASIFPGALEEAN